MMTAGARPTLRGALYAASKAASHLPEDGLAAHPHAAQDAAAAAVRRLTGDPHAAQDAAAESVYQFGLMLLVFVVLLTVVCWCFPKFRARCCRSQQRYTSVYTGGEDDDDLFAHDDDADLKESDLELVDRLAEMGLDDEDAPAPAEAARMPTFVSREPGDDDDFHMAI
jgi:hypothetical protein